VSFIHLSRRVPSEGSSEAPKTRNLRKDLKSTIYLGGNITTSELGVKWSF
jgi:hypothetical protein